MNRVKQLQVLMGERPVGTLALYRDRIAAFEYDETWLSEGFSISPFSLPLEKRVFIPKADPFEGMFGVFADTLPDGWGRLLTDRFLLKKGIDPASLSPLDRLALAGDESSGALRYVPQTYMAGSGSLFDLDRLAEESALLLSQNRTSDLDTLFRYGGSSGGARPKILTDVDGEPWIIKFYSSEDPSNIGKQEYDYALCAAKCGIEIPEVRLFESKICPGFFGVKRFDRKIDNGKVKRIHMVSVAGLLETSHRIPNLDYNSLMKLTMILTESMEECEKMYARMCFNVFAHNRDDHSKNFSYLYLEDENRWVLAPAYDLTYSSSLGGGHATTVNGNGSNPEMNELLAVAENIGITRSKAKSMVNDISDCVKENLGAYL